jgi:cyclic beta-1,2-glucan synthetase
LFLAYVLGGFPYAFLLILPVFEIVRNTADFLVLKLVRPRRLPRLELKDGIPEEGRTLFVISALLSTEQSGERYAKLLEEYRFANKPAERAFSASCRLKRVRRRIRAETKALYYTLRGNESPNRKYGDCFLHLDQKESLTTRAKGLCWKEKEGLYLTGSGISGDNSGIILRAGSAQKLRG